MRVMMVAVRTSRGSRRHCQRSTATTAAASVMVRTKTERIRSFPGTVRRHTWTRVRKAKHCDQDGENGDVDRAAEPAGARRLPRIRPLRLGRL
jgi:hypothetical protein